MAPTLPKLPSELIPYAEFRERLDALGMTPITVSEGGSGRARWTGPGLSLVVEHSGYGGGYGGRRPVRVRRYFVEHATLPDSPEQHAQVCEVLGRLTAPGPAVHAYHPAKLEERLLRFWGEHDCSRFRLVLASDAHLLGPAAEGANLGDRLRVYAGVATKLGHELRMLRSAKGPPVTWPVLYAGAGADLAPRLDEVVRAIGSSRYLLTVGADLSVEEPLAVSRERARSLAPEIARRKRQGATIYVEIDAQAAEAVEVHASDDVPAIKAKLRALVEGTQAKEFVVEGASETLVKPRKLLKLATTLRARASGGEALRVRPNRASRPSARLVL